MLELSEKHMTVQERADFVRAKVAELHSFFDNEVWEFCDEADPARTMKARFLLKWRTDDHPGLAERLLADMARCTAACECAPVRIQRTWSALGHQLARQSNSHTRRVWSMLASSENLVKIGAFLE